MPELSLEKYYNEFKHLTTSDDLFTKLELAKQEFLNTGNAVAELVETYQTKSRRMMKQGDIKLSNRAFYRSEQRKDWSRKYNYDWKNHARFNEEFTDWLKIMTAEAKPKK